MVVNENVLIQLWLWCAHFLECLEEPAFAHVLYCHINFTFLLTVHVFKAVYNLG